MEVILTIPETHLKNLILNKNLFKHRYAERMEMCCVGFPKEEIIKMNTEELEKLSNSDPETLKKKVEPVMLTKIDTLRDKIKKRMGAWETEYMMKGNPSLKQFVDQERPPKEVPKGKEEKKKAKIDIPEFLLRKEKEEKSDKAESQRIIDDTDIARKLKTEWKMRIIAPSEDQMKVSDSLLPSSNCPKGSWIWAMTRAAVIN